MRHSNARWLLATVLCLFLWPAAASAQETRWDNLNKAAIKAYKQADYAEAEKLAKLALREAGKFGGKDPRFAISLNNLALAYDAQGKYAQAEPLYLRALAIWEKALGPEHPDVAQSLNNLAALYDNQGKYAQAEPLYRRALVVLTRAVGPEHPDVATTLENYARMLRVMNRHDEAEMMEARAQAIRAKHAQENPPK